MASAECELIMGVQGCRGKAPGQGLGGRAPWSWRYFFVIQKCKWGTYLSILSCKLLKYTFRKNIVALLSFCRSLHWQKVGGVRSLKALEFKKVWARAKQPDRGSHLCMKVHSKNTHSTNRLKGGPRPRWVEYCHKFTRTHTRKHNNNNNFTAFLDFASSWSTKSHLTARIHLDSMRGRGVNMTRKPS